MCDNSASNSLALLLFSNDDENEMSLVSLLFIIELVCELGELVQLLVNAESSFEICFSSIISDISFIIYKMFIFYSLVLKINK